MPSMPSSLAHTVPATPSTLAPLQQYPSPITPNVDSFNSLTSTPDTVTPFFDQPSLLSHFLNMQNHQVFHNMPQQLFQAMPAPTVSIFLSTMSISNIQVHSFPRKHKDEAGKTQVSGLKDLLLTIQTNFCNTFICCIMGLVFSDKSPWNNPSLSVYQHKFSLVYPNLWYSLHLDDTVVLPTNCNLGVLQNQIGAEGLVVVIEHLPSQYTRHMLGSKTSRASYITTLLNSMQLPFIWEYLCPGTIKIPVGEETYYDEVCPLTWRFWAPNWCTCTCCRCSQLNFYSITFLLIPLQVERGYSLYCSGDYLSSTNEFLPTNWLQVTKWYVDKITSSLNNDNWKVIFGALHQLQESHTQEAQVEAGMALDECEPLLPADPPSPLSV